MRHRVRRVCRIAALTVTLLFSTGGDLGDVVVHRLVVSEQCLPVPSLERPIGPDYNPFASASEVVHPTGDKRMPQ